MQLMQKALRFTDEQSDKFWLIRVYGDAYMTVHGKYGSRGRTSFKDFESAEVCAKQAEKQINAKRKKGYTEDINYDFAARLYTDKVDVGPHRLTSHPQFLAYFIDDFYYNCLTDEAPFGSDEGADTLAELEHRIVKLWDADIVEFPKELVEKKWGMRFYPPDSLDVETLRELLDRQDEELPMYQQIMQCDRVIVATALGQVKIMGEVADRLRDTAIRSLNRLILLSNLMGFAESQIYPKIIADLENVQNPLAPPPSELCQTLIRYLDCPCQVFANLLDDDNMIYAYEQAREIGKTEGFTPLLVVAHETLLEALLLDIETGDNYSFTPEAVRKHREAILQKANTIDAKAELDCLLAEWKADGAAEFGKLTRGENLQFLTGFWADQGENVMRSAETILAKIPTRNPWELAAWVPMGGFNDCPEPAIQVAVMKRWYTQYGAVPACVGYDTWEFMLESPVLNKKAAIELAWEQYAFCADRVEQYSGEEYTVGNLADTLRKSTVWFFWWD